jgi:hypothetical protein
MAITNDHAWLSTFDGEVSSILFPFAFAYAYKLLLFLQDEKIVSDPEQFLGQVLASHNVRIENG